MVLYFSGRSISFLSPPRRLYSQSTFQGGNSCCRYSASLCVNVRSLASRRIKARSTPMNFTTARPIRSCISSCVNAGMAVLSLGPELDKCYTMLIDPVWWTPLSKVSFARLQAFSSSARGALGAPVVLLLQSFLCPPKDGGGREAPLVVDEHPLVVRTAASD